CGNSNACGFTFTITDGKKPTPYCVNGLVLEIMPTTGMVDVWASDFDAGSWDNCPGDLKLSLSPDVNDVQRIYTCDDLGQNTIQLWVTDAAGNQDYCETFVVIQDNMGACTGGNPSIAGAIATEDDEPAQDVTVEVNGQGNVFNTTMMTAADGLYSIEVPAGGDYTVTPSNDAEPLNGVSTFDLVLISKHILGVQPLDSPYKIIAADANRSNSVTTFDMVEIRKLILHINSNFPNNTSWRFVPKSHQFVDPMNPWAEPLPEVLNFNNVTADILDADFVAIKVGDVNGNAAASNFAASEDRTTVGKLTFVAKDVRVEPGARVEVPFTAKDFYASGYQFTLEFDRSALEFAGVEAGVANADNFGTALLSEGVLTASWNAADAQRLADNEVVFTLVFTGKAEAQLSDLLSISSRYTKAEAYNENGELLDVELAFTSGKVAAPEFALYQNTPNPFGERTVIGFTLPEATRATLTISDVTGKVLKVIERDFNKGYNEVIISRDELPAAGVLYYQLDTPTDSASRKMILID
ncbi:MAG: T9SS C-terminal target domain-containing protein, partial [Bacteroidetes bacterium]